MIYCLNKKALIKAFGEQPTLVAQMLWAVRHHPELKWLKIVREGRPGVELQVDRESADRAYARWRDGENPPLMPSQIKYRKRQLTKKAEKTDGVARKAKQQRYAPVRGKAMVNKPRPRFSGRSHNGSSRLSNGQRSMEKVEV